MARIRNGTRECCEELDYSLAFIFVSLACLLVFFVGLMIIYSTHSPKCVCQGSDAVITRGAPTDEPTDPDEGGESGEGGGGEKGGGGGGDGIMRIRSKRKLKANYVNNPVVNTFRKYLRIRTDHPNPDYCCASVYIYSVVNSIDFLHVKEVSFAASSSIYKPVLIITWRGLNSSLPSILLNSHMDVVGADASAWTHHPFLAFMEKNGDIYGRGAQDGKVSGMMYLEAIRNLIERGFVPTRNVHVIFTPDKELGGEEGFKAFAASQHFRDLNVGVALDGGLVSSKDFFIPFNGERAAWWLKIMASRSPTHGVHMLNNGSLENLFRSINKIMEYRQTLLDKITAGADPADVTSISPTYLSAGSSADPLTRLREYRKPHGQPEVPKDTVDCMHYLSRETS
ncbi:hypothetical protein R1flu_009456 [Riccia fluitans]|uniref:N-acyl-L-amino-acid amidohydrolase n=1 Tax=Riccia fluitans TaxID=41844 RepID=A0ABD1Z4N6_9MARC